MRNVKRFEWAPKSGEIINFCSLVRGNCAPFSGKSSRCVVVDVWVWVVGVVGVCDVDVDAN